MGQCLCGDEPDGTANSETRRNTLVELPDEDTYLGLCWLAATTVQSFSPSRWLPASATCVAQSVRPHKRRCFSVSKRCLKESARKRNAFMVTHHITMRVGLTLTGHDGVAVAGFALSALSTKSKVQVGGVPVDISDLAGRSPDAQEPHPFITVVGFWRAEVEMDPPQYAVLGYERYPVRAPPATDAERELYGEGCVTGLRYGGYVVVSSSQPIATDLQWCLKRALADVADVALEGPPPDINEAIHGAWQVRVHSSCSADDDAMVLTGGSSKEEAMRCVASWCAAVYQNSQQWSVVSVFMQRYEAIGECLLRKGV